MLSISITPLFKWRQGQRQRTTFSLFTIPIQGRTGAVEPLHHQISRSLSANIALQNIQRQLSAAADTQASKAVADLSAELGRAQKASDMEQAMKQFKLQMSDLETQVCHGR